MSFKKHVNVFCGISLLILPMGTLSSREVGGGARVGGYGDYGAHGYANIHPRYYDRRYVDPNYYYYGNALGDYEYNPLGVYEYNLYQESGSQPGMTDDSNALYNSYLESNQQR